MQLHDEEYYLNFKIYAAELELLIENHKSTRVVSGTYNTFEVLQFL